MSQFWASVGPHALHIAGSARSVFFPNVRQMLCCELLKGGNYPKHPRHYLTLDTTHSITLITY